MSGGVLRVDPADLADGAPVGASLLALNNAHEVELSRLDRERFHTLVAQSWFTGRIGGDEAFLMAFDQSSAYDGHNFRWFRDRMARFIYVDRIVVSTTQRGQGHARRLYETLFDRARTAGHDRIVCEVNSSPPNPVSDRFHAAFGFQEVGSGPTPGGHKTVRYLMLRLGP